MLFDTSKPDKDITPKNRFIEYWNSFPETATHRRDSKLYRIASQWTIEIIYGKFDIPISEDWMTEFDIKNYFNRPIKKDALISAIDDYVKQFDPEYFPQNKNVLTRSYKDFLYNEFAQTSPLLWTLNKPPRKRDNPDPAHYTNQIPEYILKRTDSLLSHHNANISDIDRAKIYRRIIATISHLKKITEKLQPYYGNEKNYRTYLSIQETFQRLWIDFIYEKPYHPYMFNASGYTWEAFVTRIMQDLGIDIHIDDITLRNRKHVKQKKVYAEQTKKKSISGKDLSSLLYD
jgi:hypothetical protein